MEPSATAVSDFITIEEGCHLIGGDKRPISKATFYRGVKAGRFSAPFHPTPGISRLSRSGLLAEIKTAVESEAR